MTNIKLYLAILALVIWVFGATYWISFRICVHLTQVRNNLNPETYQKTNQTLPNQTLGLEQTVQWIEWWLKLPLMFSNIFIVFILLIGAAILGFIVAWLFRQNRIDKISNLVKTLENKLLAKDELIQQYATDRDLLKEESEKYKQSYNEQLTKNQRLAENIRRNHSEVELSSEKINKLTEMSVQAQEEIKNLSNQLEKSKLDNRQLQRQLQVAQSHIEKYQNEARQAQAQLENLKKQLKTPQQKTVVEPQTMEKSKPSEAPRTMGTPKRRVISETRRVIQVNRPEGIKIPKGKLSLLDKQKRWVIMDGFPYR